MTDWYVDPAAAGLNNGSSWTDAFTMLQAAIDTTSGAVAGDTIYCRGTLTISGTPMNTTSVVSGAYLAPLRIVGCNAAGTPRAGQFVIQGDSANKPANLLLFSEAFYKVIWENITWDGANVTSHAVQTPNVTGRDWTIHHWKKCKFINSGGSGLYLSRGGQWVFIQCVLANNTGSGALINMYANSHKWLFCKFQGNGSSGLYPSSTYVGYIFYGCLSSGNADEGFYDSGGTGVVLGGAYINCVVDDNGRWGIKEDGTNGLYNTIILGCRITNHASVGYGGLFAAANLAPYCIEDYNVFYGNTVDRSNYPAGDNSETADNTTEQGYVDQANGDYNLTPDAIRRSTGIDIDWDLS